MNNRIKELAEQAGCAWREGLALRDMSDCQNELEKFAELIIQECTELFTDDAESMTWYTGIACKEMIKHYFRVTE